MVVTTAAVGARTSTCGVPQIHFGSCMFRPTYVTNASIPALSESREVVTRPPLAEITRPGDLGFDGLAFPVNQIRLSSGMRVAIEKAATREVVAVVMTVGPGAANDPPGTEGLAHFTEHLVFLNRRQRSAAGRAADRSWPLARVR